MYFFYKVSTSIRRSMVKKNQFPICKGLLNTGLNRLLYKGTVVIKWKENTNLRKYFFHFDISSPYNIPFKFLSVEEGEHIFKTGTDHGAIIQLPGRELG